MFNENPKEETVIAMRNREIRLNREGEYWTDEEKEQLRTMFEAGFGITKIAYVLCRTEPAVYQQIESMGLQIVVKKKTSKNLYMRQQLFLKCS